MRMIMLELTNEQLELEERERRLSEQIEFLMQMKGELSSFLAIETTDERIKKKEEELASIRNEIKEKVGAKW